MDMLHVVMKPVFPIPSRLALSTPVSRDRLVYGLGGIGGLVSIGGRGSRVRCDGGRLGVV